MPAGPSSLPDPRVTGLARLLGEPGVVNPAELEKMVLARAGDLGAALASEAAACDDVYDEPSATSYLELRLALLAEFLPDQALPEIRRSFAELVRGW